MSDDRNGNERVLEGFRSVVVDESKEDGVRGDIVRGLAGGRTDPAINPTTQYTTHLAARAPSSICGVTATLVLLSMAAIVIGGMGRDRFRTFTTMWDF